MFPRTLLQAGRGPVGLGLACLALACLAPVLAAPVLAADGLDRDLADLAGRVDYGFYTGDRAVLEAARAALEQLDGSAPPVAYYRGLANLRIAQLAQREGRPGGEALERCIEAARLAVEADGGSAEPWILLGACSALAAGTGSLKSGSHERRVRQAIERVQTLDPGNPRLELVKAWAIGYDVAALDAGQKSRVAELLGGALAAFAARPAGVPDWGEAEAAVALGAVLLDRGDVRAARDRIEQALLIAPGFETAVALRRRLVDAR